MMDRMMKNFAGTFGIPEVITAEDWDEYLLYQNAVRRDPLATPKTFKEWKLSRAARGNQEGQNHD